MEITSKFRERENQSPLNSPSSHGSSTTTSTCSTPPTPQPQPIPITRSDPNSPYPTTFVTADTSSFKQVVQMLTGSSDPKPDPKPTQTQNPPSKNFIIPPVKTTTPKKQGFKLYERRNSLKHMMISPLTNQHASFSPRHYNNNNNNVQEILSPSLLDFPSLTLSPVTPLVEDPFNKSSPSVYGGGRGRGGGGGGGSSSSSEEERAIAEKGFYLHPSPRDSEPRLLPLFPLSSPRMSGP